MERIQTDIEVLSKCRRSGEPFYKNVAFMMVLYWTILVMWQNFFGHLTQTLPDTILKAGLLCYFSFYFVSRAKKISIKASVIFLMAIPMMATLLYQESMSLRTVIDYAYPVIFILMIYGLGDRYEISKSQLLVLCNWIIAVVLYCAIYAVVFCSDQFANAFLIGTAYGNELSSFFVSSHEYGTYLIYAIICCFIVLRMSDTPTKLKRLYYYTALVIFLLNLILTFSRTSIFALAIFLVIYIILGKGKLRKWVSIATVAAAAVLVLWPGLSEFLYNIVLKKNNPAGRDLLYAGAVNLYRQGSVFEKLFGYGSRNAELFMQATFGHSSAHNAYLEILISYGCFIFGALVLYLASQMWTSLRFIKTDRFWGVLSLGLCVTAAAIMFTNTPIIFTSPIDSYFLTAFMFVVPKYVRNAMRNDRFY